MFFNSSPVNTSNFSFLLMGNLSRSEHPVLKLLIKTCFCKFSESFSHLSLTTTFLKPGFFQPVLDAEVKTVAYFFKSSYCDCFNSMFIECLILAVFKINIDRAGGEFARNYLFICLSLGYNAGGFQSVGGTFPKWLELLGVWFPFSS